MIWEGTRKLLEEARTGNNRELTPMIFLVQVTLTIQTQEEESLSLMNLTVLVLGGPESEGMGCLQTPLGHMLTLSLENLMMCLESFSGERIHLLTSSIHLEEEED